MQLAELNREQFLGWIGGKLNPEPEFKKQNQGSFLSKRESVGLVWLEGEETTLNQPRIVVPQSSLKDFFAFANTYIGNYKPLSAFYQVYSSEEMELIAQKSHSFERSIKFDSFISVAMFEALMRSRHQSKSFENITTSSVGATLSASLMSAIYLGYGVAELKEIRNRWDFISSLSANRNVETISDKIVKVWIAISSCVNDAKVNKSELKIPYLAEFKSAYHNETPLEKWFIPIASEVKGVSSSVDDMMGAREIRVKALVSILNALTEAKMDSDSKDFVAGGILSMLTSGSISQIDTINSVQSMFPSAPLWFGAFSALHARNDALRSHNSLGAHAVKHVKLLRDDGESPLADISFHELAALGQDAFKLGQFRTQHQGKVQVRLLGQLVSVFRNFSSTQSDSRNAISEIERQKIAELAHLLERAGRLSKNLVEHEQRELFESGSGFKKRR